MSITGDINLENVIQVSETSLLYRYQSRATEVFSFQNAQLREVPLYSDISAIVIIIIIIIIIINIIIIIIITFYSSRHPIYTQLIHQVCL